MKNKLLVSALKNLEKLQKKGTVFQGKDFTDENLRVLRHTGFIEPIMRGWYYSSKPNEQKSDTTAWYISYIEFIGKYLYSRFKNAYCFNPENSILFHVGIVSHPKQIVVMVKKPINEVITLPHDTSIVIYNANKNFPKQKEIEKKEGLNLYSLEKAICSAKPMFYKNYAEEAQLALNMMKDISPIISILLTQNMKSSASRIVGVLEFMGRDDEALRIKRAWKNAYIESLSSVNPFEITTAKLGYSREKSPYALRIRAKWEKWREAVATVKHIEPHFVDSALLLKEIEEKYSEDAYHSLSIEGYKVTKELIEKVSTGEWNPDEYESDKETKNALAAKGYFNAFQTVLKDIFVAIDNEIDIVDMLKREHHEWYSQLFSASVVAGIIGQTHLAGYRTSPIYLRNSTHVPLPSDALIDAMEAYFDMMKEEKKPFVKAVLGHRLFGYIHPYFDGNGRMARFIMNAILTTNGYPWLIIRVEDRDEYLSTLEIASGEEDDILPFADFIARCLEKQRDSS